MTREEAIKFIQGITYEFKSSTKIWSKEYPFKPENLKLLKDLQTEIPALKIYEKQGKFLLMRTIEGELCRDSYRSHDYECGIY